jgi:hypothetical protein
MECVYAVLQLCQHLIESVHVLDSHRTTRASGPLRPGSSWEDLDRGTWRRRKYRASRSQFRQRLIHENGRQIGLRKLVLGKLVSRTKIGRDSFQCNLAPRRWKSGEFDRPIRTVVLGPPHHDLSTLAPHLSVQAHLDKIPQLSPRYQAPMTSKDIGMADYHAKTDPVLGSFLQSSKRNLLL